MLELNCKCNYCGKMFHVKPYHLQRFKTHYCSKECQIESKRILMSGSGNHQYGLKGSMNATWKSDRKKSRYGYWMVRSLEHPLRNKDDFMLEHRLVAERFLLTDENSVVIDGKKYLSPKYIVHHINGNRLDNRVENLCVMTAEEHSFYHNKGKEIKRDSLGRFINKTEKEKE